MKADLRKIWSVLFLVAFIVLLGSCEKNDLIEPDPDPVNFAKSYGGDGPDDDSDDSNSGDGSDDITDDEDDQDDGDITDDEDDQDDSDSRSTAIITLQKE